jgi:Methyltransferase domain
MTEARCNLCGSTEFRSNFRNNRPNIMCSTCFSVERTRVMALILKSRDLPRPRSRILHCAPERGLAAYFRSIKGVEYYPVDIDPQRYRAVSGVHPFDLCSDIGSLPSRHFDLIIHSHVIEHVPCNYTAVLFHLHRALKRSGLHILSIPILEGAYDETTKPLTAEEATERFGQEDHVRKFGVDDLSRSLGLVFRMPDEYDLAATFSLNELLSANIPSYAWRGYTQHSVFVFGAKDCRLSDAGPSPRTWRLADPPLPFKDPKSSSTSAKRNASRSKQLPAIASSTPKRRKLGRIVRKLKKLLGLKRRVPITR